MADVVHELLSTETAERKLGARGITLDEARQPICNHYVVLRNPNQARSIKPLANARRLMVGLTDGGRALTLVIERTIEPTDWLLITGWSSANHERRMLER